MTGMARLDVTWTQPAQSSVTQAEIFERFDADMRRAAEAGGDEVDLGRATWRRRSPGLRARSRRPIACRTWLMPAWSR
ncbi:MAG: hypothetical protein R3E86_04280 [Pseudomonadales bacterium]